MRVTDGLGAVRAALHHAQRAADSVDGSRAGRLALVR